jgi:two-component system, LytTR family, sensor kinase
LTKSLCSLRNIGQTIFFPDFCDMNFLPKKNTWLQILFWGALWALIPYLLSGNIENSSRFFVRSIVVLAGIAVVVTVNMEVILPRLYFSKKQMVYIVAGLALVAVVTFLVGWDGAPWAEYFGRSGGGGRPRGGPRSNSFKYWRYISTAMPYFTSLLGSTLFEIASFANRKEKEATDFQNEKLETEMKFLKSQVNPHFLFNALNNIYTLSVLKSEKTPDNLLKLSGMLRYMLYDCRAETVPLQKEIEYLRHFIGLNMLKDSRGLNVTVDIDESNPNLPIAPMLFVPFVENAFKHSKIEDLENGWIIIKLATSENSVSFDVQNSLPEEGYTKDQEGGIGLKNVRRRLELVYPGRHELRLETGAAQFDVHLKINVA